MEIEKRKVEIDEINLGFCLIHVIYKVLPCGYTYLMGAYRIERKHSIMNKMTILEAKQVLVFPNLSIYYEQYMAKSVVFLDYYNNVYCHNPSLGLATKARGCKVAGQERKPENEKKCEGMNPHSPKGASTLGVGVPVDSRMFRERLQGSKPNGLKSYLYH